MDAKIVQHSPADKTQYVGCVDYAFHEWAEDNFWLWTSYLSHNCFALAVVTTKAGVLFHFTSRPPDDDESWSARDPYKIYSNKLFEKFKEAWQGSSQLRSDARLFVVTPTHAYSQNQENAVQGFIMSVEEETKLRARHIKYAPRDQIGWATLEVYYESGNVMPRVFVNAEPHNPSVPLWTPALVAELDNAAKQDQLSTNDQSGVRSAEAQATKSGKEAPQTNNYK